MTFANNENLPGDILSPLSVLSIEAKSKMAAAARHLENSKNSHISAAVQPILTKSGMQMQFEPLDRPDRRKFKVLQIQSMAGILTI